MSKLVVTVNHNKCVGSQLCMQFLPEMFKINAHGQSEAMVNDSVDINRVLFTAEQCPQCAIKVSESDTGMVLFPPPELEF